MLLKDDKNKLRQKRHLRVRNHIHGTAQRPRLNVQITTTPNIYVQIIDDEKGVTLANSGSFEKWFETYAAAIIDGSRKVGELIAKKALDKGITEVVLDADKATFNHGAFNALAEAAVKAGLKILSQRGNPYCWTKKYQTTNS